MKELKNRPLSSVLALRLVMVRVISGLLIGTSLAISAFTLPVRVQAVGFQGNVQSLYSADVVSKYDIRKTAISPITDAKLLYDQPNTSGSLPVAPTTKRTVTDSMKKAMSSLSSLGIVLHDSFSLFDKSTISRNDAIRLAVQVAGKESEALWGTWKTQFKDLTPGYEPYVGYAHTKGWLNPTKSETLQGNSAASGNYIAYILLKSRGISCTLANALSTAVSKGYMTAEQAKAASSNFMYADAALLLNGYLKASSSSVQALVNGGTTTYDQATKAGYKVTKPAGTGKKVEKIKIYSKAGKDAIVKGYYPYYDTIQFGVAFYPVGSSESITWGLDLTLGSDFIDTNGLYCAKEARGRESAIVVKSASGKKDVFIIDTRQVIRSPYLESLNRDKPIYSTGGLNLFSLRGKNVLGRSSYDQIMLPVPDGVDKNTLTDKPVWTVDSPNIEIVSTQVYAVDKGDGTYALPKVNGKTVTQGFVADWKFKNPSMPVYGTYTFTCTYKGKTDSITVNIVPFIKNDTRKINSTYRTYSVDGASEHETQVRLQYVIDFIEFAKTTPDYKEILQKLRNENNDKSQERYWNQKMDDMMMEYSALYFVFGRMAYRDHMVISPGDTGSVGKYFEVYYTTYSAACSDVAQLNCLLMDYYGIPNIAVTGKINYSSNTWADHMWNLVYFKGKTYNFNSLLSGGLIPIENSSVTGSMKFKLAGGTQVISSEVAAHYTSVLKAQIGAK